MNTAEVILRLLQGATVLTTTLPTAVEAARRIKQTWESSGQDYTVEIRDVRTAALLTAEDTERMIREWRKSLGLTE